MNRAPSWQAVATALAARMRDHAHCAEHSLDKADLERCPWCADRAAYRIWQQKAGHLAPADPVEVVDIDVLRHAREGEQWA